MSAQLSSTYSAEIVGPVDGSRVVRFRLNTGSVDRHGTRFLPRGCRSANYLRNPVFTWGHAEARSSAEPDDVIGRAISVEYVRGASPSEDAIDLVVEFEGHANRKADRCLEKVRTGFLRAVSIYADPLHEAREGEVPVCDAWDLLAASLCIVGSNPEALALRAYLAGDPPKERSVETQDVLTKLGLEEGASYADMLVALVAYLGAGASEEDKALITAVTKLKPEAEPASEPDSDEAEARTEGTEKEESKEDEEAMRAAVDALGQELRTAKARIAQLEQRAASPTETAETPDALVEAAVQTGRWSAGARDKLLAIAKRSLKAAKRAIHAIPEGTFAAHRERLRDLGKGGQKRSAPNFGADPERIGEKPAPTGEGKRLRDRISADIGKDTKLTA